MFVGRKKIPFSFYFLFSFSFTEKDTMDVWCNGQKMETAGEFVEDGTETHFTVADRSCCIKAVSSGKRKEGIIHTLIVDNREIPEAVE